MKSEKLKVGDLFYDSRLYQVIPCYDSYFNQVYDEEKYQEHLNNGIKYYAPHFTKYRNPKYTCTNNFKKFKVAETKCIPGTCGMNDHYPDIHKVICSPVEDETVQICFAQDTFGYDLNMDNIEVIFK